MLFFTIVKLRNLQCSNVFEEIFLVQSSEFFGKIEAIEAFVKGILVLFLRAFFPKTLSSGFRMPKHRPTDFCSRDMVHCLEFKARGNANPQSIHRAFA